LDWEEEEAVLVEGAVLVTGLLDIFKVNK